MDFDLSNYLTKFYGMNFDLSNSSTQVLFFILKVGKLKEKRIKIDFGLGFF